MESYSIIFGLLLMSPLLADAQNTHLALNRPGCEAYIEQSKLVQNLTISEPINQTLKLWEALVLLIAFGIFALLVSIIYRLVRTYVFYDSHMLDTFFDAGGDVNMGLIACSVVAKWSYTSSLSWSGSNTREYGIVGHFWYAAGAAIQLLLFAIVMVEIRIKSPGAKTYLQVIYSRFGAKTHILLMIFALFTNLIIAGMVVSEGTVILSSISSGIGKEVVCIILAIVIGIYTVVGGVGGSMYVAYFGCVVMMSIVLFYLTDVYYNPLSRDDNPFGSIESMYNFSQCGKGHDDNERFSLMTFLSKSGVINGAVIVLSSFSAVFVNQSFWQSGVAGKPGASVGGFLTAGLVWFAIPFGGAFALGMAYWAFSLQTGKHILNEEDTLQGLIPVITSQKLLGKTGDWLMFTFTMVAVVTTASGEVLSASSIIIYDIYQTYVAPFIKIPREDESADTNSRTRKQIQNEKYLQYDRRCCILKNIAVLSTTVCIIPTTLVILKIGIDLQWLFYALAIIIGSCVLPIALAITWHRVTGPGVMSGVIAGFIGAVIGWLAYASTYEGGLSSFHKNTSEPMPVLVGTIIAVGGGGLVCVIISLACGGCSDELIEEEEWEKTRKVDNPILSWSIKYAPDIGTHQMVKGKPHFYTVRRTFKSAEICAYIFGVLLAVGILLVWPACMLLVNVFSYSQFKSWAVAVIVVCAIATMYITIVPLVWEVVSTCRQIYFNRQWSHLGKPERLQEENSENSTKITDLNMLRGMTISSPVSYNKPQKEKDAPSFSNVFENESSSNQGKDSSSVGSNEKDRWKTFIHIDE